MRGFTLTELLLSLSLIAVGVLGLIYRDPASSELRRMRSNLPAPTLSATALSVAEITALLGGGLPTNRLLRRCEQFQALDFATGTPTQESAQCLRLRLKTHWEAEDVIRTVTVTIPLP